MAGPYAAGRRATPAPCLAPPALLRAFDAVTTGLIRDNNGSAKPAWAPGFRAAGSGGSSFRDRAPKVQAVAASRATPAARHFCATDQTMTPVATTAISRVQTALISGVTPSRTWL